VNLVVVIGFLWVLNPDLEPGTKYGYSPLIFNSLQECVDANKVWSDTNKTVPITLADGAQRDVEFKTTCTVLEKP
jgi:hypothetical protein